METFIIITAILLAVAGVFGSVFPGPGPPLVYVGMLLWQWQFNSFSATTLWVFGILNLLVIAFDYLLPIWVGKRFGASSYGAWGSILGMIAGIFFTPIGMFMGIILGAIIGEYLAGRSHGEAFYAGLGTFIGTVLTIVVKLFLAAIMSFYILREVYYLLVA